MTGMSNRRALLLTIGAAVAPLLVAGITVYLIRQDRAEIQADNRFLQREIAVFDEQIKEIKDLDRWRSETLSRMRIIEALSSGRLASQEMLLTLSQIPEGIQLTQVEFDATAGLIHGRSLSPSLVSVMNRQLRDSTLGWTTRVNHIAESPDRHLFQFRIELSRQALPRDEGQP